jgi:hypothetical protein
MLTYQTVGPTAGGDYLVDYPTPGAPHVFTAACCASNEAAAKSECARLNKAQQASKTALILIVRKER